MKSSKKITKWSAQAPSNIALIKYMGKFDDKINLAINDSLSYTLDHLISQVDVEVNYESNMDCWEPLICKNFFDLKLSPEGQSRFLKHVEFLKKQFSFSGHFTIRSANNFPSDCGLASSASSFAALTMAIYNACLELNQNSPMHNKILNLKKDLAKLSRHGSGSSCRSFDGPWVKWTCNGIQKLNIEYQQLLHMVIIVDSNNKQVSSSQAHKRVTSSKLFSGRYQRVQLRLQKLIQAFDEKNWAKAFQQTWEEFHDMHALFETSVPSFSYMTSQSIAVLEYIHNMWINNKDGPLVTMDAGANIHLLFRHDQKDYLNCLKQHYSKVFNCLSSEDFQNDTF